jgi:hypothetical protein
MRNMHPIKAIGTSLIVCGMILTHPFAPAAQEAPTAPPEKPAGETGRPGMMKHWHRPGMKAEMQKMHEQMEAMHQEMAETLHKQLTALRAQAKAMEGISDEKQLLTELKKHQEMTDELLGTMIEQHEKMHAQMAEHHEQMQKQMGKKPGTEKQEPEEHETQPEGK